MFDSSPLPLALLGLWATLPGIWLGATALTELLPHNRYVRRMLRPAAAAAGWIVAVQIASMATGSFWIGLPTGMILLSLAGLALWWKRPTSGPAATPQEDGESDLGPARGMWLGMIVVAALVAMLAFNGYFHDLLLPGNGHMAITAQLQNDYFPPRFIGFPHVLLRYHYGSDLLAAGLTALTRLRIDWAIDLLAVVACAYLWCLLWTLGQRVTGTRKGGLWVALATMLGGGFAAFLARLFSPTFPGSIVCWERRRSGRACRSTRRLHPSSFSVLILLVCRWEWLRRVGRLQANVGANSSEGDVPAISSRPAAGGAFLDPGDIMPLALSATLAFTEIVLTSAAGAFWRRWPWRGGLRG